MDDLNITLNLKVPQVNTILNSLSKGSYLEVADIIALIQYQAKPQVENFMASQQPAQENTDAISEQV